MSNYNELLERIGTANAKCGKLNEELRVREGKRQAFSTQLETAIADYKAKYGVDITPATIDEELVRVSQSVEADLKDLESLIALIESGQYDEANAFVGGTEEASVQATPVVEEPVQSTPVATEPVQTEPVQATETVQPMQSTPVQPVQNTPVQPMQSTPVQPVVSQPVASQPTVPVHTEPVQPMQSTPVQPVAPSTPIAPVHPSAPVVPNVPLQPTIGQPVAPSTPLSGVDSMLGGALAGFQPASSSVHPTAPPISGLGGIQPTVNQQASPTNFQDILNGSAFGVK